MGMPRKYKDRATKQWAYRHRQELKRFEELKLRSALEDLLRTAQELHLVTPGTTEIEQIKELDFRLLALVTRARAMGNVTHDEEFTEL